AKYLEENPAPAHKIMKKVILSAEAREAAAKAKKALKDRKSMLNSGGLPGKLMDCTSRDRDDSELFLVEGQSAGGSAESGRNRMYQAILPLRGKVLNVEKAQQQKMLSNEEICSLISAVGIDIGNSEDLEGLRYGKVIILTDADVDGQHIRTLLLTFFYRQMQKLIQNKRIFVARPPLFKVAQKKNIRYVQTAEEMNGELMQRGLDGTRLSIEDRGSKVEDGKKPAQQGTILEGDKLAQLMRVLSELEESLVILERRGLNLTTFLTRAGPAGLPRVQVVVGGQEHWFHDVNEADAFLQAEQKKRGQNLVVGDESQNGGNGQDNGHAETIKRQELHEVKGINSGLEKLREFGLGAADLIP